ncbi:MAG: M20/M25/M40 family metallo-hydrolase [Bacteroidales bacterium]|nr:M20/M25/M40 family metallo-hydrolase [Bacteroidales bacterium]
MSTLVPYTVLLKKMISIPATSREEDHRAGFLEEFLRGLGHDVKRIHNNLLLGDPEAKGAGANVLLNSHLDTVAPVEGWTTDPYGPVVEGERITGLGSNDAGASVVAMITTYHKMVLQLRGEINLMLLLSAEEEVSGANGIDAVLPQLGTLDGVIVGEPTGMHPAVAERGLMVLDGAVEGKAGHAARKEGVNAIYRAMEDVKSIASITFPEQSEWLPAPGAQVTMISAGTGHNVVPDLCSYVVDVRSNDRYGNKRILELISSVCVANLVPRSTRLKSSSLHGDHVLMKTIQACSLEPFGSSTLSDMALIPFPSVKMGPGDSARSHTAGEYILQSELEAGVTGYCTFLTTLKEQYKIIHS